MFVVIVIVIPVLANTTQERFYLWGGPVSMDFRSRDFRIESFLHPGIRSMKQNHQGKASITGLHQCCYIVCVV